jgi:monoamine oxidase
MFPVMEAAPRTADSADVVIAGAGMAGLVAARELNKRGLQTVVVEPEKHSGGRVHTERHPGAYLEHGGIFHTRGYRSMRRILAEVGLDGDVRAVPTGFHGALRYRGAWQHADFGSLTGPLTCGALSPTDKFSILRAAAPALPARPADLGDLTCLARLDTRSAAAGLSRRAAGYFTAGPHEFLWGTPTRRLTFAMLAMQLKVFTGELREIQGGTGRLVAAIAEDLDIRHGSAVERVDPAGDGVTVALAGSGEPLRARAAILACPADVAARLWPEAPAPVSAHLSSMCYSRIDYVYLRTRTPIRARVGGKAVGMQVVTEPEVAASTMGGIYYANDWTADGSGLLLVSAAPSVGAQHLSDDDLADRLQADVEKHYPEVVGQVTERVVMRHHQFTPIFEPGSLARLTAARRTLPAGRVDLAGDHMSAPWVEGAIRSGQQAAERVAASLGEA